MIFIDNLGILLIVVSLDLLLTCFTVYIASQKGYSAITWVWLGLFFSLIAFFASIGLPNKNG